MKIKRVKSERDVKGGQFYIRAVINHHGDHWVEVFRIAGKAYNCNSEFMVGYRKLRTIQRYSESSYTGDLGIGRKNCGLFEYSSKVHNYLLSLTKREFFDVVNRTQISDFDWDCQVADWEWNKQMEDEYRRSYENQLFECN